MVIRFLWAALACIIALSLRAEDFAPIPAGVWAIKGGVAGAVILEKRLKFQLDDLIHTYRVRIFSEAGRGAAELSDLPSEAKNIHGRTVYPDGKQVVFNNRKDFAERKVDRAGTHVKRTYLVAPGVTSDCVVEVRWSEPSRHGIPLRLSNYLNYRFVLSENFPIQSMVVDFSVDMKRNCVVYPGGGPVPIYTKEFGFHKYTFTNMPSFEVPPYCLQPIIQPPAMDMFMESRLLANVKVDGADAYWGEAVKYYFRPGYEEHIFKGKPFGEFSQIIRMGLPATAVELAGELMHRLEGQIANLSSPTFEEQAAMPENFWRTLNPKNLDDAVKSKRTNSEGMKLLFYHLLLDAGLKPKIAKVPDRDVAFFNWQNKMLWQFGQGTDLIGVSGADGATVWFEPTTRFMSPGIINPDYTGVYALQMDTALDWKASRVMIGGQPGNMHVRKYDYQHQWDDENHRFHLAAEFSGFPELLERRKYVALDPSQQAKKLKESFQELNKNLSISNISVANTSKTDLGVKWSLDAAEEREGQRRMVVVPFPGMPWPIWIPDKLEATRKHSIVLPYLFKHVASCKIKIPKGYVFDPSDRMDRKNHFGKVMWIPEVRGGGDELTLILRVELDAMSSGPERWDEFKVFLGWIEDACRRTITLVREA